MENYVYLISLVKTYGYFIIAAGILLECMGIPMPGETMLVLGGVAASLGHLNIVAVIITAAASAVIGDNFGYMIGKKFGRRIIKKFERFPLFHYQHIERAEKFFKKHGAKTVFIGRFTAILRTYSALFAGILNMDYLSFFLYNLSGGVLWAIIFGLFGYIIGNNVPLIGSILVNLNLVVIGAVVLFVVYKLGPFLWRKRKANRSPQKPEQSRKNRSE